jgi:type VII secretion integral membrane protein EccD
VTTSLAPSSGIVRVTVSSDERRVDLALPAAVTVAELLPEIARMLGVLDPSSAHTGFRLLGPDGAELSAASGLTLQNVQDGAMLTLVPGAVAPPRVYDDVVEAMADVVESSTTPWEASSARRTALFAAGSLLMLGAVAIGLERTSVLAGALAGAIAVLLLAAAVVLSRLEHEDEIALMLGWGAVVYATVGAFTALSDEAWLEGPTAAAGGAAAVTGALAAVGIARHRMLMLPAVILGAVGGAGSGLVIATDFEAADVYLTALVLLVVAAGVLPTLALAAAGGSSPQPQDPGTVPDDPDEVPIDEIRTGALTGHSVLLAITVTSGLLIALVAPLAVTLGLTGTLTAAAAAVALLVRTRQYRSGAEVGAGLISAAIGVASIAVSILVLRPDWRPGLVIVLTVLSAGTLLSTLIPVSSSVARGRAAEMLEVVALVAMLPLLVIAIGIVSAVRS